MFGMIGGMNSILCIFATFFVMIFSSKIYMLSLLSNFYYVNSEKENSEIQDYAIQNEERKESVMSSNLNPSLLEWESSIAFHSSNKKCRVDESSFSKSNSMLKIQESDRKDDI